MTEPIKESVKARGHTAPYKMHKYFARRPCNVFSRLVEHYTDKGDIVLDCFCGGGVTVFESLALDRKVVGVDINPLATFITQMQIQQVNTASLQEYYASFFTEWEREFADLYTWYEYEVQGEPVRQEWMEWVYEVRCPKCGGVIRLTEENKISNGKYRCPDAECESNRQEKAGVIRTECAPYRSVPLRMKYSRRDGVKGIYEFKEEEKEWIFQNSLTHEAPRGLKQVDFSIPHNWDRWYEDCLPQKGVFCFSDLFTKRNYYINLSLFHKILSLPASEERDLLYFAFSASLRYTNKMSHVTENWENGNPTCMDKHAYWLPNIYVECNVLQRLKERMAAVIKGLEYTKKTIIAPKNAARSFAELSDGKDYLILTQSASTLPLPDESISAVITDPPYGSNVQYGELSSFWNIWYKEYKGLDNFIYNREEAVCNRKACFKDAKDVDFYGEMLGEIFTEAGRVLKSDGYLVFTFNNKDINVWVRMLKAVVNAGFYLPEDGVIFQDFVEEYKNTSHLKYAGNIHGDFIYSFKKGKAAAMDIPDGGFGEVVRSKVNECLESMYRVKREYTTTELYEKIYGRLIHVIIQFVCGHREEEVEKTDELSKAFIDNLLSRNLEMKENKWTVKEGADFC